MWRKKLRQKRHQFLLIGIVLLFTTAIFAGCVSFTLETNVFGDNFFKSDKCPDMVYLAKDKNRDLYITENKDLMKDIKKINTLPAKYITAGTYCHDENLLLTFSSCMALDSIKDIPYYFELEEHSSDTNAPKHDEVWLNKAFADEESIHLGDIISFRSTYTKELKVTGFYNTATIPSNMMGIFPMFVSQDTLDEMIEPEATYIMLKFKDKPVANNRLPNELIENLYYSIDRAGIIMSYSTASTLFGGLGTIASLIVFIVAVILIRFILRSTIIREYRSIGIYKSLGFTSKQIKRFYLNCYAFVGAISIPLGILLGLPLAYILGTITNKYLGGFKITGVTILASIVTFLILMFILLINVLAILRRLDTITPVKALNIGMTSSKKKMKHSVIKHAHTSFAMAINQLFKKKSMSFMVVLVLSVSFYLCLFFSSINYTCIHLGKHTDVWFGMPKVTCGISTEVTDELLEYLSNNPHVEKFVYGDYSIRIKDFFSNNTNKDLSEDPVITYNSYAPEDANFNYIKGRAPRNPMEISITTDMLDEIGGDVGDYVSLQVNGTNYDFLITGIFSSMLQGGHNIHTLPSTLDKCNVGYYFDHVEILLADGMTMKEFQVELNKTFPNLQVEKFMPGLQSSINSIESLSKPIMNTLVVVFTLFSVLNVINLMIMNSVENRKQYGILKSLGFTNRYICAQNIYKNMILATFAAIVALVIDQLISRKLFFMIINVDALIRPVHLKIAITCGMWALIIGITYLFTVPIKKISPTELMEE